MVLGSIAGVCMFSPNTLTSSHHRKTCEKWIRLICYSKLRIGVNESVNGCLSSHHMRFRLSSGFGPKSNMFDSYECTIGCLQRNNFNNQWEQADWEASPNGCSSFGGITTVKSLLQIGVWSCGLAELSSVCAQRIPLLKIYWNCHYIYGPRHF